MQRVSRLGDINRDIISAIERRCRRIVIAFRFLKGGLVTALAGTAAVAQFITWPETGNPTTSQIVGIGASAFAALFGFIFAFTDVDSAHDLKLAVTAMERARQTEETYLDARLMVRRMNAALSLAQAQYFLIDYLREQIGIVVNDDEELVRKLFKAVSREISIACGFEHSEMWSLDVQKPVIIDGQNRLQPIISKRAVDCGLPSARTWPINAGPQGRAFATGETVAIADLSLASVQSALGVSLDDRDTETYRSFIAAPIKMPNSAECWGVVIATSNRKGHFSNETGVSASQIGGSFVEVATDPLNMLPIEQFAELLGLALAIQEMNLKCHGDVPSNETSTVTTR